MIFFFRWVVGIWLVMKLSSDDLLDRLKKKGTRDSAYTKAMIIDKLNDNDADIASTNLKVTVSCPLGKMRMRVRLGKQFRLHIIYNFGKIFQVPCRPQTCSHLQCFDAATFLQMNERKPTWNCPVCDSKAFYNDLQIDGYFQEVLESKNLPEEENDIILDNDGSWKTPPKDEEAEKAAAAAAKKAEEKDIDCIDLSDDDEPSGAPRPPVPPASAVDVQPPPPPPPMMNEPLPPMPPAEIECIDLD